VHGAQARAGAARCRGDWDVWMLLGGRGSGKTLAGATAVIEHLRAYGRAARVGVMAPIRDAARDVCMEGPTGLALYRDEFTQWNPSRGFARHRLGGVVYFMSAEKPARWNGPQWSMLWADELALCNPESWAQADLGLRLGAHPRAVVTTTPKGSRWLRELSREARVEVVQASTYQNPHLSSRVLDRLRATYEGTTLGKQELLGEWLDFVPGAVFPTLHAQINEFLRPVALNVDYVRTGAGVDWGTTVQHQSAIVAGSTTKPGQIVIRRAWKSATGSSYELAGELASLKEDMNITFARVDRSQGSLIDVIDALGLDAGFGVRDVEWRISLMLGLIERKRIVFDLAGDGVRELFDSLCQYHRDDEGRIVEEADDDVDACLYLIAELEQPTWEPPERYGSARLRTRKAPPRDRLVRARSKGLPGRRTP
jgi:phage terminase large subunit-like protein